MHLNLVAPEAPEGDDGPTHPAHVGRGPGSNEWYTPDPWLGIGRAALNGIDLDPASCALAQENVRACAYLDRERDGLAAPWWGRVWLNPPYSDDLPPAFAEKLRAEVREGRVKAAAVLTNNFTETVAGQILLDLAHTLVLVAGRVRFLREGGAGTGPKQGQMLLAIGAADGGRMATMARQAGANVWRRPAPDEPVGPPPGVARAWETVRAARAAGAPILDRIGGGLAEAIGNAAEHGAALGADAAPQVVVAERYVEVRDAGPGIPRTLEGEGRDGRDPATTLLRATTRGVTRSGRGERGLGLGDVLAGTRHGLLVTIESGGARLVARPGAAPACETMSASPGTHVRWDVRA